MGTGAIREFIEEDTVPYSRRMDLEGEEKGAIVALLTGQQSLWNVHQADGCAQEKRPQIWQLGDR